MPFLLTTEPWVPCLDRGGARVELGLRDVLVRAHELGEVHDTSPLATLALHRLLLAILHRVFGPPDLAAWRALYARGSFDAAAIDAYLAEWRERFDLLHPERPFYQTRGLRALYEPDGLGRLVFERTNYGAAVLVFQHRSAAALAADALGLAEATRTLLVLQSFAPGGLVKKKDEPGSATAAPLNRGAYVLVRGRSLFETLLFNLLVCEGDRPIPRSTGVAKDRPAWEQEPLARPKGPKEPSRAPLGWIDLLTWQSRRLELDVRDGAAHGVVYCVGHGLESPGVAPEPMLAYQRRKDDVFAVVLSERRALWRDAHALVQFAEPGAEVRPPLAIEQLRRQELADIVGDRFVALDVLGMRGDQAKVLMTRHDRLTLPASIVRDTDRQATLREALRLGEDVALRLVFATRAAAESALAPGDRKPDPDDVRRITASLDPERAYWAELGAAFSPFVDGLARDEPEAVARFEATIRHAAEASLHRATEGLGTSARQLQGGARAERQLRSALMELMPHRGGAS